MPRLTNTEYLIRRDLLQRVWRQDNRLFGYLSAKQQRDHHDYYQTTRNASDEEVIGRRAEMTEQDPSLPHRASRAFLALLRPPEPETKPIPTRPSSKNVTIRPVLKPKIDMEALASALLDLVASLPKEERDKLAKEGREIRERRDNGEAA